MRSQTSLALSPFILLCLVAACAETPSTGWNAPIPGAAPAGSPVAIHGQLSVAPVAVVGADGTTTTVNQLVDQNGTPTRLKGTSSMWLNWESAPYAESKKGLQFMRDSWGVSIVRAAMGVEAGDGYLTNGAAMEAKVKAIVQNAIDLGVYVLVDWHTEKAANQTDASVAFFTEMASKYGAYPNVIWEPYNEPNGFTWAQIKPYHQAVVDAVRAVDPDNLMVLGTPSWSQKVDEAAADPVVGTNLLYTLHFYACTHGQALRSKADTAIAQGLALMITEFGVTFADGGTSGHDYVCEDEGNLWFAWMAQNNVSGVAWKLDQCADSSCILKASAQTSGPWNDNVLTSDTGGAPYAQALPAGITGTAIQGGHGQFVVGWMKQP
jgi:endoglucanase